MFSKNEDISAYVATRPRCVTRIFLTHFRSLQRFKEKARRLHLFTSNTDGIQPKKPEDACAAKAMCESDPTQSALA